MIYYTYQSWVYDAINNLSPAMALHKTTPNVTPFQGILRLFYSLFNNLKTILGKSMGASAFKADFHKGIWIIY